MYQKKCLYVNIAMLAGCSGVREGCGKGCVLLVNFAPELQEIIAETKYLDYLGILTPSEAQNVALQENKFLR